MSNFLKKTWHASLERPRNTWCFDTQCLGCDVTMQLPRQFIDDTIQRHWRGLVLLQRSYAVVILLGNGSFQWNQRSHCIKVLQRHMAVVIQAACTTLFGNESDGGRIAKCYRHEFVKNTFSLELGIITCPTLGLKLKPSYFTIRKWFIHIFSRYKTRC